MRSVALTTIDGGIQRLRIKGGANPNTLYELLNGYLAADGSVVSRPGTVRDAVVASTTRGLCGFDAAFHVFSHQVETVPSGYVNHVLAHPDDPDPAPTIAKVHFAQPLMGFLYVACEWSDGKSFNYWLVDGGAWEAGKVYRDGDVVHPTAPNGLLYKAVANNPNALQAQKWAPRVLRVVGDKVLPTVYNGYYYEVEEVQGDVPMSGNVEPAWIASVGAVVIESTDTQGSTAAAEGAASSAQTPTDVQERYGAGGGTSAAGFALSQVTRVPKWQPGTLYSPGDLVIPSSVTPPISAGVPNGNFESGDSSWTKQTGWHITNSGTGDRGNKAYQGAWFAKWVEAEGQDLGWRYLEMAAAVPVIPGQAISASCYDSRMGGTNSGMDGQLVLRWYDDDDVLVYESEGTFSGTSNAKDYRQFTVSDITPGGATQVALAYRARGTNSGGQCAVDNFTWDYANQSPATADFTIYQAVQAEAAVSGTSEPEWPGAGDTVVDGGVTWMGGVASTIKWIAHPIMQSGDTEPAWSTDIGASVPDGTISWKATTGLIEDPKCPHSEVLAIAAKKVFAADDDIAPYTATVNPLDWSTADDAGYLPFGLNNYGSNPAAAMGLYRGNLVIFNAGGYQMWQVDPDPQNMALLDAQPVGSTWPRAVQGVADDLLFLTKEGVRNLGASGPSASMQAGGVGQAVDPIVKPRITAGTYDPISLYYPARGQYWLIFGPEAIVLTINGSKKSWSRYVYPEAITDASLRDEVLYLRTAADKIWLVDETALVDDYGGTPVQFLGRMQWPYIDAGALGINKMLHAIDVVATGTLTLQVGFNQSDPTSFCDHANFATSASVTPAYTVSTDTLAGQPIPLPVNAPSYSLILTFAGNQAWSWQGAALYVDDQRGAGATT